MQPECSTNEENAVTEQERFCVAELIILFEASHHTQRTAKSQQGSRPTGWETTP